jgi:N-acyl homoserine lactone hydrolase
MSGVRRIVPLTLGWEELPRSVSVHGAPADERLREPVPVVPDTHGLRGIGLSARC